MSSSKASLLLAILLTLIGTSCVRKVTVPEPLPVKAPVSTGELVERINSYQEINIFWTNAGVQVRDYRTTDPKKAADLPEVNGILRFQRPEMVRMFVSFLGKDIADMTSDGREFRLAVFWPNENRMFVRGSNFGQYRKLGADDLKQETDPRLRKAGSLANIRPQHVTQAFMIRPIPMDGRVEVFREEARQAEREPSPGGAGSRFVEKTYYILYVLERNDSGKLVLQRKFWFDRTQEGTPMARQQIFENGEGRLGSDISYKNFFQVPNSDRRWARDVEIDRRNDGYGIRLRLDEPTVEFNRELPAKAFELENERRLKEVNLDDPASTVRGEPPRVR